MSNGGVEVPPLTRVKIRSVATAVRRFLKKALRIDRAYFPIVELLDVVLPKVFPEFSFEVRTDEEMGNTHGLTLPSESRIIVKEDVYMRARAGEGRDRFTLAHELGHLMLHQGVALARSSSNLPLKRYVDSEWQADAFAGELLMSYQHLDGCKSPPSLVDRFGVSFAAAECQWGAFEREGIIKK